MAKRKQKPLEWVVCDKCDLAMLTDSMREHRIQTGHWSFVSLITARSEGWLPVIKEATHAQG